ncbi:hypothetical protein ACDT16_13970, partial [Staphylococcus aureus]
FMLNTQIDESKRTSSRIGIVLGTAQIKQKLDTLKSIFDKKHPCRRQFVDAARQLEPSAHLTDAALKSSDHAHRRIMALAHLTDATSKSSTHAHQ